VTPNGGRGLVAPGLRLVPRSATICNVVCPKIAAFLRPSIFRSKFNVALGIEAQGFCIVR
jgi:hypothetical protein